MAQTNKVLSGSVSAGSSQRRNMGAPAYDHSTPKPLPGVKHRDRDSKNGQGE